MMREISLHESIDIRHLSHMHVLGANTLQHHENLSIQHHYATPEREHEHELKLSSRSSG